MAISIVVGPELVPVSSDQPPTATIKADRDIRGYPDPGAQTGSHTYTIVAKGVTPGDAHTKFILSSANVTTPITAEESTTVY